MFTVPRLVSIIGGVAIAASLAMPFAGAAPDALAGVPSAGAPLGPQVTHSRTGPTGYTVTFRIYDPTATAMKIKGAWSFASTVSTSTDPANANPIPAAQWSAGDFPLQSPNQPSENWPVADMVKDPRTGVWSYTTPLPSGVWDYQFLPGCTAAAPALTGCTAITDPANPAWNTTGTPAVFSQVYVPADTGFGTADQSWEADAPAAQRGKLAEVVYPTTNSSTGSHPLAVYTPPGYDPHRSTPYPMFVLSHGGGENEITWSTRGRLAQILDNLIAAHQIQPAIVVMPDGAGIANSAYTAEITNNVIPYVEQNYHVSTNPGDRAFAGTSAYGTQANNFLFQQTAEFGYYGVWSPAAGAPPVIGVGAGYPAGPPTAPAYANPQLKQVLGIHLAIGQEDLGGNAPMLTAITEREGMINSGVPFTYFSTGGGHTWTFWRLALRDFLTRVAFRTTSTTVTASADGKVVATVTPSTSEPTPPTGTVQFLIDGQKLGNPVQLHDGKATLNGYRSGGTVTTVYSGDSLYNGSTSAAVTVASH